MTVQHTIDGVLSRVAAVEGQQHLNSSNNTALGSEVQVSSILNRVSLRNGCSDSHLQLLGQTIKQIQTELAVSSAKSRGGGPQDTEALIANVIVSIDKSRAQCMKAVEQVDAGTISIALFNLRRCFRLMRNE